MRPPLAPSEAEATIGVAGSKHRLDAHRPPAGEARQFANDPEGIRQRIPWAQVARPARIVFEATGADHRALALGTAKRPGVKINPLQARRFAEATGQRAKTDPVDAARLGRFGAHSHPDAA